MRMDPLADLLNEIKIADRIGKREVEFKPASKLIQSILTIMKEHKYIEDFEVINDERGGVVKVKLRGRINNCNVIKPRYFCKLDEFEKYEKRYLLSRDFGILIVSTSKGIMTHREAKEKGIGGVLVAYVY
ncbi:MAG: 30S ribosomal protein S8 [Candidatus Nanoarchaeia archaeon]|nr:30S ribosomal protein S8 [Candidatus Haiyanarchaeum thermophilum]MCW1303114.1 30S ribosomal protein S8 [Candidatus Haiyanarchaeum thermophilum]MCW1303779.1 30S ribosomal protein S8 [Candidatus Haiyanarchaeum thermophilum]MCW1306606.1 30S ribosomal protein S8 [Candidatus Haiyanarchaeum thermophilum]MCW1307018.1 30S ribosomal protein S8 [Candidatus Haiyanarchaeum thermophilum]